MGTFLAKIFVKDYKNTGDPKVRERYGKFAGIVGIISNAVLCTMKIIVGLVAGSIAIVADGINNLADASSSIITLIGFKLAAAPEDKDHPYGHARIEYLTGLFISVLIIVLGLQLLSSSFRKVLQPDPLSFSYTTVIILVIAIVIKIWQALFNMGIGKKINSVALMATGADSRNDVISTSAVLVSIFIGKIFHIQLDGYMGCLVALFIVWSGIQLIRETSSPLLGEAPDADLVRAIEEGVLSHEGVIGIHDLVVHNYGPGKIFASIHIEVDAKGDLMESHDMIDNIERYIKEGLHIEFTAHMDPVELDNPLISQLYKEIIQTIKPLEGVHSIHDLRIVPGKTHTNIIFDAVLTPSCKMSEDEISRLVDAMLKQINPTYFVVITFDKAYTET
ncbi:cation diffusion facilitator family transporter [Ihubacter massiliensis]|uniref:Cation diffusion facilitator family transporter n=1 Tax=Hominibacterium faecale TaxID=2839743 RepID=A0A9J6QTF5_9FIRM|nr:MULTISPECIES: cation diffusion facilitator family transporter [Eubacteriales Family XIII. Incertae Sedis]MCO7123524.1 cation diffusion facilitator family transporter [Ihubacter massiliensis]MCU7379562.1 cation diffusion facilitator family transporter [Hominibacterium faecale]MDE8734495.1 cation diffusion facilitator family transporter [Eubacteriales bacterium DFI.9.88]